MRSLADDLRLRDDEALAELLRARPDLVHPVPPDIGSLATRAGSATSVARALDSLDAFTLQVAETLAALDEPASADTVFACFDAELKDPIAQAVHRLVALALAWGDDPYRMVRTARDAFGPHPGGLGPSCVDLRPRLAAITVQSLRDTLADAPAKAIELLDSMLWGSPIGQVDRADRVVTIESAKTPIEWLLARDLLVPRGPKTVALPREVGFALREIRTGRPRVIDAPAWPPRQPVVTADIEVGQIDQSCGLSARAAVDTVTDLLELWSVDAPPVLRSGGLGVRDLAHTARSLNTDEHTVAFWLELCLTAGLLARDGQFEEAWRPTKNFDDWVEDSPGERWAHLAVSWWHTDRAAELVRGAAQPDPAPHALSEGVRLAFLPALRADALGVLGDCSPGSVLDPNDIAAVLEDRRPRVSSPTQAAHIRAAIEQAELLGVTGLHGLGTAGRALLAHDNVEHIATTMEKSMPDPVDHVLIQGDLTAIAPGPLHIDAARQMRLLADTESSGAATVFRFSESSLRRGFDAGRDAQDILSTLETLSATPLPQALEYLVADLGRRHGRLRVGIAGSYIRSEDASLVRETLSESHGLNLVELAPGVLASPEPPDRVLAALREAGLAPLAETPDGRILTEPTRPLRAPARSSTDESHRVFTPRSTLIDAAVATLRATQSVSTETVDAVPTGSTKSTLATLREALASGGTVRLGYVDSDGEQRSLLATPVRLAPGTLTAMDHSVGKVKAFTLARITGAVRA